MKRKASKWMSLLLTLTMALSLLPTPAAAVELEEPTDLPPQEEAVPQETADTPAEETEVQVVEEAPELPLEEEVEVTTVMLDDFEDPLSGCTNEELEDLFVESLFYGNQRPMLFADHGILTGDEKTLYDALKAHFETIATSGGATRFDLSQSGVLDAIQTGSSPEQNRDIIGDMLSTVLRHLRNDFPEYFYWQKKGTLYNSTGESISVSGNKLTAYPVCFPVDSDYAASGSTDRAPVVDNSKLTTAANALAYAQECANDIKNSGSTLDKLRAAKDKVCELTEYNDAALSSSYSKNDAWQLVTVFDNDPSTKVVCEGYAKAFQYLCDLVFTGTSGDPEVYCVSGTMNGGGHMWNIVHLDGQNYLVDATNCDAKGGNSFSPGFPIGPAGTANSSGAVAGDGLFMINCGGQIDAPSNTANPVTVTGSVDSGYTVTTPEVAANGVRYPGQIIQYQYYNASSGSGTSDIVGMYGDVLDLSVPVKPLTLSYADMPSTLTIGDSVTLIPTVSDGTEPYAYAVTTGTLPDGLNLDVATGMISGSLTTYCANDTTVTVTVKDKSSPEKVGTCTLTFPKVEKKSNTVSFQSPETSFVEGTAPQFTATATGGTVQYQYTERDKNNYTANAPTTKGLYTVKAFVKDDSTFADAEATHDFAIVEKTMAKIEVTGGPTKKDYVAFEALDPSGLTLTVTYNDGNTALITYDESNRDQFSFSYQTGNTFLAGDTTVTVTYGGKSATITVDPVGKAALDVSNVTWEGIQNVAYDGNSHTVTLTHLPDGLTVSGYTGNEATYVGTYQATPALVYDTDNYVLSKTIDAYEWTISPVDQQPTITGSANLKKGGSTLDLNTLVMTDLPGNVQDGGTVSFAINGGTSGSATLSGTTLTSTEQTGDVILDVAITAADMNGDGQAEYNAYQQENAITVTVVDKTPQALTVSQKDGTYGTELTDPSYDKIANPLNLTVQYEGINGTNYTSSATKPKNAGEYKVSVQYADKDNVYSGSASFKIAPKTLTAADLEYAGTAPVTKTYDGTKTCTLTESVRVKTSSLVSGDTVTITGTAEYTSADAADSVNVIFTADAITSGNYSLAAGQKLTIPGKIEKKAITPAVSVAAGSQFTGKPLEPKVTVTYTDSGEKTLDSAEYDLVYQNNTNAGTDIASVTVSPKANSNFTFTEVTETFSIAQADAKTLPAQKVQFIKTTSGQKSLSLDLMPQDAGALTFAIGQVTDTGILVGDPAMDQVTSTQLNYTLKGGTAGTASFTVTIQSLNYADSTVEVSISLTEKEPQAPLTITSTTGTYGQDLTLAVSGGSSKGAVTYSIVKGGEVAELKDGVLTPKKAGQITIQAVMAGNETYEDVSAEAVITIHKAKPTGTPSYTKLTAGQKLSDAKLGIGSIKPEGGQIQWVDPENTVVVEGASYQWKYTPTDPNYESLTGSVVLAQSTPKPNPDPNPNPGGGSSSGGGSYNPPSKTETTKNPDGSTTTTVTKADGTKVETTKGTDGSQTVVETKKDGTVITTETDKSGNKTKTVENKDGSSVTEVKRTNGTTSKTTVDRHGNTESEVKVSSTAVKEAVREQRPLELPMPPVRAEYQSNDAPVVKVDVPTGTAIDVSVPVTYPTPGTVAVVVHPDGREEVVRKSTVDGSGVTFAVNGDTTVKIVDNTKYFADVPTSYWAADNIAFVTARGLYNGTSASAFSPEKGMTRGMLAKVLHNLENNPQSGMGAAFTDVNADTWCQEAVSWAADAGIITGYADGSFHQEKMINREQLAVMLYRYAGSPAHHGTALNFSDANRLSGYAQDAMSWAVENGIIGGTAQGTLNPQGTATRAQVAAMLTRFLNQ